MDEGRRYAFSWDLLGDVELGRPNLGPMCRVEVYRLMQFSLRDAIESELGTEAADRMFRAAGRQAGMAFYDRCLTEGAEDGFIKRLQMRLREMGIGLLRMERVDPATGRLTMTLDEDLDCSGLPELDYEICAWDEGFIAGIFERASGAPWKVEEIDCWCTGGRTCRFSAERSVG